MKIFDPPGSGSPAGERGIPSRSPQWRDVASSAKAVGRDRFFRRPRRDEWRCRDDLLQDRTGRACRWVAGSFGQAMSTALPVPAALGLLLRVRFLGPCSNPFVDLSGLF